MSDTRDNESGCLVAVDETTRAALRGFDRGLERT